MSAGCRPRRSSWLERLRCAGSRIWRPRSCSAIRRSRRTPCSRTNAPMLQRVKDWWASSEVGFRRALRSAGARIPPRRPNTSWMNTTLRSAKQVEQACAEVRACGLPPHPDRPKNWDALSTLDLILRRTDRHAAVLEVGAALYSVTLPWLYLFGYRNLRGIDLVFDKPLRRGPIRYEHGDLTTTRFGRASFDVIVSLSVIEH